MPIQEIRNLPDCDRVEYVTFYVQIAEFNNLNKTFLTLLYCIPFRHHEGCNTICDIIQNPELHRVRTLFIKNPQFISYITNSAQELDQAEMISVTSSNQLRLPIEEMNP